MTEQSIFNRLEDFISIARKGEKSQSHFSLKFSSGPLLHIRQPLPPFPLPA